MIKIGVNEKVYIAQAEKVVNDEKKASLAVGFAEVGTESSAPAGDNPLDLLNEASDSTGESNITKVVIFPPNLVYSFGDTKNDPPKYNQNDARPGKDIFDDFVTLKNMCAHILKRYKPEKEIKFDLLAGIGIAGKTPDQIVGAFAQEVIRDKVFNNLCEQFSLQIAPFLNDQAKASRLFLTRASQTNHFGTIRRKYLDRTPFYEDANISIKESKMYTEKKKGTTHLHSPIEVDGRDFVPNFSVYELQRGLDSAAPITDETGVEEEVSLDNSEAGLSPSLFTVEEDSPAEETADGDLAI